MKKSLVTIVCLMLFGCGTDNDNNEATKTPSYTISTNVEGEGEVTPKFATVLEGANQTFSLLPKEGYALTSVVGCNGEQNSTSYVVSDVKKSCEIEAVFNKIPIQISLATDQFSRLYTDKSEYYYNDSAVITFEVDPANKLQSITGCNGTLVNEQFVIEKLTSNCQVTIATNPTTAFFTDSQNNNVYVEVANDQGAILPTSQGIIKLSDTDLPLPPESIEFNRDLLAVNIATEIGSTIELKITYQTPLPAEFTYQKLINNEWIALPQDKVAVSEDRVSLTLTLTDGGAGDSDKTANGIIKDPGAPATLKTYPLVVNQTEGGKITPLKPIANHGETVLFTIEPDEGYELSFIEGCNGTLASNTFTTGAITQVCTVNVGFIIKTINVTSKAMEGGAITPAEVTVNHGETTVFTITPDEGQNIASVQGCNGTLQNNTYTTGKITEKCEVIASFNAQKVLVTAQAGSGGIISPLSQEVIINSQAVLTVTPNSGYGILSVTGCNGTLNGNIYTTSEVTANCEVQASFSVDSYTVSASAGEGGTVNPATQSVNHGNSAQITITASEGYSIDAVTGCSGSLNGNTYTTGAVTANCQVQASFSINSYTVSASAGEGGTVNPATQNVNHGSSAQITITPNEGYSIDAVTGCSGSLSGNIYTTGAVTANCQVQASFSINNYTVSASAGEGGAVNPATQSVNHGSSAQITITPNEGYSIDAVTGCGGSLNGNTYTTAAVTTNCQVQASFSINKYTVSASAGEGGTVNPATQSVNHGSSAQITITPNEGYSIDAVTGCSGSLIGNTYTTGAVTANCQVQASFNVDSYTVTASAGEGGTVKPTQITAKGGSEVVFEFSALNGFNFLDVKGCSDGEVVGNNFIINSLSESCDLVFESVPVEMESIVEVNTENITLDPKGLFLINDTNSKELKSALTTNIATEPEQQKLVMLTTEFGEPMLLGIKHEGDKSVELSVESSAYVFIATSSYLYGVEFNDTKTLFSRFKQHVRFGELEEELIKKINNGSPCPMDSLCSFRASIIAEQIAKETTIEDLVVKEEL